MLPVILAGCGAGDKNEVRVFCYGDYMDPKIVGMFEKETGIHVVLDTFDTSEEMYPVIKNRAGVYDVICPSDYMIERMISEDLLVKLNRSNIPNLKNIDERYLKMTARFFDPGNKYAVPYQLGTAGILYNSRKVKAKDVDSWSALWNKKFKNKIVMQDSLRDTIGVALKAKGYSINSTSEKELKDASDYLIRQKPLVYKYANDSARDLLIGNSASLGITWNGEMLYSQELNKDLKFAIPKEGTEVFFDCWVIPKNAFHKDSAEKWINFMCREDVALMNFEYLTYSTPNKAARRKLPKHIRNNEQLFPNDSILQKSELLRDLGPKGDALYSQYWKRFKSR